MFILLMFYKVFKIYFSILYILEYIVCLYLFLYVYLCFFLNSRNRRNWRYEEFVISIIFVFN